MQDMHEVLTSMEQEGVFCHQDTVKNLKSTFNNISCLDRKWL